jgi:hypothetical protein
MRVLKSAWVSRFISDGTPVTSGRESTGRRVLLRAASSAAQGVASRGIVR